MKDDMLNFQKNALLGNIGGLPLCAEYKEEWRKCGDNKLELIKLALRQQSIPYLFTACNNGLGLSKEYLQEEFADYINGNSVILNADNVEGYTYSLYVGFHGIGFLNTDVCALMWSEKTFMTVPNTKCPTIYIGCNSDVHLSLDGFNSVRIYLFDNSNVEIYDADEESSVIVYKYSDDANVTLGEFCFAPVNTFRKELKL